MSEVINKNKYLDFSGLQKYDTLIKALIESGNQELAASIVNLDAKIGNLELEGSDGKNLSEIVTDLYNYITDIVAAQDALETKDTELEGKINDIIGDLESLGDSDPLMTLVEVSNKLKALNTSVVQNTSDISGVTTRLSTLEETVKNLGEIEGGQSLGDIVNKVNANTSAIETLNGDGDGSVKKTAAEAAATAVAAIVAGAESDFDTLKEVADWIASDTQGSAALQATVSSHTESISTINGELDTLESKVDADIANLTTHMANASAALAEVDGRLDVLEAFEETHTSIATADIEGLFA